PPPTHEPTGRGSCPACRTADLGPSPAGRSCKDHPPGTSRCPYWASLSILSLPHELSCAAGWSTGGAMTVYTLNPPAPRTSFDSAASLIEALGISFSTEQLDAITA